MQDQNQMGVKSPGVVPGIGNDCPLGSDKISNTPPPRLKHEKIPHHWPGGWALLELTDASNYCFLHGLFQCIVRLCFHLIVVLTKASFFSCTFTLLRAIYTVQLKIKPTTDL